MKKSIKTIFGFLFISLFLVSNTSAQNKNTTIKERTKYNINKRIELINDSQIKELKIAVDKEECRFDLKIYSFVRGGAVEIEIYDPKGKKKGNFSVGNEVDSDQRKESVSGMIAKLIENPMLGDWKVKVIPQKANGDVTIRFTQDSITRETSN